MSGRRMHGAAKLNGEAGIFIDVIAYRCPVMANGIADEHGASGAEDASDIVGNDPGQCREKFGPAIQLGIVAQSVAYHQRLELQRFLREPGSLVRCKSDMPDRGLEHGGACEPECTHTYE